MWKGSKGLWIVLQATVKKSLSLSKLLFLIINVFFFTLCCCPSLSGDHYWQACERIPLHRCKLGKSLFYPLITLLNIVLDWVRKIRFCVCKLTNLCNQWPTFVGVFCSAVSHRKCGFWKETKGFLANVVGCTDLCWPL